MACLADTVCHLRNRRDQLRATKMIRSSKRRGVRIHITCKLLVQSQAALTHFVPYSYPTQRVGLLLLTETVKGSLKMPIVPLSLSIMKLRHFDHDGRARFVTFCTHRRIPILTNNQFRMVVTNAIDQVRRQQGFQLIAYVIMPEHVHLVILPEEQTKIGQLVGEIKRIAAIEIHQLLAQRNSELLPTLTVIRNGHPRFTLWQRRCFDHNCRSENSLRDIVDYCHYNPVKRGLVKEPEDWQWSSCRWYQGIRDVPIKIDYSG